MKLLRTYTVGAAMLAGAILLAGCAGQAPTQAAPDETAGETLNVGLFITNAFGDQSYFDAAHATIPALEDEFGAKVTTYEGKLEAQNYGPLLQDAADANELVYVVGNQAIDAVIAAAADNPDTTFVFVNGVVPDENVTSVAYRYAESCYAGGTIAGIVSEDIGASAVGFMAGFEAPSMADCEAGLTQGAKAYNDQLTVVSRYVGSFSDPAKGLETATAIAQEGAYVMYATAGLSNQGAVTATENDPRIAPIVQGSPVLPDSAPATVNDDTSVLILAAAQEHVDGTLEKGVVKTFGFAEGAFIVEYNDAFLDADQQKIVEDVIASIVNGEVEPQGATR